MNKALYMAELKNLFYTCLVFALISCEGKRVKDDKEYRFYDFSIFIETYDPRLKEDFIYIYSNVGFRTDYEDSIAKNLDKTSLHRITLDFNVEEKEIKRVQLDTVTGEISFSQLDTLYLLTRRIFDVAPKQNLSNERIPSFQWDEYEKSATVVLNLGFRGPQFQTLVEVENSNDKIYDYKSITEFMDEVLNSSIRITDKTKL